MTTKPKTFKKGTRVTFDSEKGTFTGVYEGRESYGVRSGSYYIVRMPDGYRARLFCTGFVGRTLRKAEGLTPEQASELAVANLAKWGLMAK